MRTGATTTIRRLSDSQWNGVPSLPLPLAKKSRLTKSSIKTLLIPFFDSNDLIHGDFFLYNRQRGNLRGSFETAAATHTAGSTRVVPVGSGISSPGQTSVSTLRSAWATFSLNARWQFLTPSMFSRSGACRLLVCPPQRSPERLTLCRHCGDPTTCDNGASSDSERSVCWQFPVAVPPMSKVCCS